MKFILHAAVDEASIERNLGRSEYSYFFVMKAFRPALERIGTVVVVRDPATEVDPIYEQAVADGEPCLHLAFAPPHKAPVDLKCPTVAVVAWEFSNIPDEIWGDEPRNDWRYVLARHGRCIVLSNYTAAAIRTAMGADFPVAAIVAPVTNEDADVRGPRTSWIAPIELVVRGHVIDSRADTTRFIPDEAEAPPESAPVFEIEPTFEIEPSQEAEPPQVDLVPEAEPLQIAEAGPAVEVAIDTSHPVEIFEAPAPPPSHDPLLPPRTLRYRFGVTKRHLLEWYREALKDLMPRPVAVVISRSGGLAERAVYRWLGKGWRLPEQIEPPIVEVAVVPVVIEVVPEPEPEPVPEPEPPPSPPQPLPDPLPPAFGVTLAGVVYTSVFNPKDGRKNWIDLVTGFCWAFRDVDDAVLVLKMIQNDADTYQGTLAVLLDRLAPFKCRVVTIQSFLADADFQKLIGATSYYVNGSNCEGLCLPLMEFMAAGCPVIAPVHTAMADYVDDQVGFTLAASLEHNVWPHDSRDLFRTLRYRINWASLLTAYRESYRVAKTVPERYVELGLAAAERMRRVASVEAVEGKLRSFLAHDMSEPTPTESIEEIGVRLLETEAS